MRFAFINLQKASIYDVREWLRENINLTEYQKQKLLELDIRDTNLCFYKKTKKTTSVLLRLTIIFIPIVFLLLVLGIPINYLLTGYWAYDVRNNKLILKIYNWLGALGL